MENSSQKSWQKAKFSPDAYPLGTLFNSFNGGYWEKTENGYKWCTGNTFPNVGGDWDGTISLPENYFCEREGNCKNFCPCICDEFCYYEPKSK